MLSRKIAGMQGKASSVLNASRSRLSILVLGLLMSCIPLTGQTQGTFAATGGMKEGRAGHGATLLRDGKVLVVGGWGYDGRQGGALATAEVYDPSTGTFTPTGSMTTSRWGPTATLLNDGRVLVAGGLRLNSAELYDPSTGTFSPTGDMTSVRYGHAAILLPKFAQSRTVSVDACSAAVLPNPVGLMMPDAFVPLGRFIVMV